MWGHPTPRQGDPCTPIFIVDKGRMLVLPQSVVDSLLHAHGAPLSLKLRELLRAEQPVSRCHSALMRNSVLKLQHDAGALQQRFHCPEEPGSPSHFTLLACQVRWVTGASQRH